MKSHKKNFAFSLIFVFHLILVTAVAGMYSSAQAQSSTRPKRTITLAVGKGTMIKLPRGVKNVFVADPGVADARSQSGSMLYVLGVKAGETTLYATNAAEKVIYSANILVGNNFSQIDQMIRAALPGSNITVNRMNGLIILGGSVKSPGEVELAERITKAATGDQMTVINQIRSTTPNQVMLQVKIAEVTRSIARHFGTNLGAKKIGSGNLYIAKGRNHALDGGDITTINGNDNIPTKYQDAATLLSLAGKAFGMNMAGTIDALASVNLARILSEPTLTAMSGETADFLAGGEFAVPVVGANGSSNVSFKNYGMSLEFTPTVINENRIILQVKPEISQISTLGGVSVNGITIPGVQTRRTQTTIELASGQSFMIAGLLSNNLQNNKSKTPGLGDLPIVSIFGSTDDQDRTEQEIVIIITPYLVKPTDGNKLKLPTDKLDAAPDWKRWLMGKTFSRNKDPRKVPLSLGRRESVSVQQDASVQQKVAAPDENKIKTVRIKTKPTEANTPIRYPYTYNRNSYSQSRSAPVRIRPARSLVPTVPVQQRSGTLTGSRITTTPTRYPYSQSRAAPVRIRPAQSMVPTAPVWPQTKSQSGSGQKITFSSSKQRNTPSYRTPYHYSAVPSKGVPSRGYAPNPTLGRNNSQQPVLPTFNYSRLNSGTSLPGPGFSDAPIQ